MATISQQLIAGLQNPSMLAPLGKAAQAVGYYPTQLKKQGMLEQIQNAKTEEDRAKALIEYGKLSRNDNMILKGTDLMRQAKKSGAANDVARWTNALSTPGMNPELEELLVSHIGNYANKAGLNMGNVLSGVNKAVADKSVNLSQAATKAVNSGMKRSDFERLYNNQGHAWDAANIEKTKQNDAVRAIANRPKQARINELNTLIAQESQKPPKQIDSNLLGSLERELVRLRSEVGDSKAYESVGVAQASITGAQDKAFAAAKTAAERAKFETDAKVESYTDRAMASPSPISFIESDDSLMAESNDIQEAVALAVDDRQEKLKKTDSQSPRKLNAGEEEAWKKSKDLLLQNPMIKAAWTTYNSEQASLERKIDAVKVLRSAIKAENERLQSRETRKEVAKLHADTAVRFFLKDDAAQRGTLLTFFGFDADVYDVVENLMSNESLKSERATFMDYVTDEYVKNPEASPSVVIPEVIQRMQFDIPGESSTRKRQAIINKRIEKESNAIDARVKEDFLRQNPGATEEEIEEAKANQYLRYIAQVRLQEDMAAIRSQPPAGMPGFNRFK